jgi:hypothetical protein
MILIVFVVICALPVGGLISNDEVSVEKVRRSIISM